MQYMPCWGLMAGDEGDDKIIREREFRRSSGIDIIDIEISELEDSKHRDNEEDGALGEIIDPLSEADALGSISEDAYVDSLLTKDTISSFSIQGEKRINWVILVSMVVLYSAISIQIGRTFNPLPGAFSLLILALVGFTLGEIWIPKKNMSLLGVTWIIISMKVLYGLAIELRSWGIIDDDLALGVLLLFLVGLNIWIAYRHDHDAIAAQSTLVLLAIGSATGTEFGELGVAVMILIATMLLHAIAVNRGSGNLASLGIASSNLWIGMHAVTTKFEIGPLEVLPIEGDLLLFLLLMSVTSLNALMAAKFATKENWFSKGFETLGLGKPGLWGVSISLGMIGAMLAVASNREELGYALGMVTFLGGAFGGSYLVVRGVESKRVWFPLTISGILLTGVLLGGDIADNLVGFSSYEIFTVFGAITTVFVILRDQSSVTDRVLWVGSVAILSILVLLVPTNSSSQGRDGLVLLSMLSILHLGTGFLAVSRKSSSLSGVTVLLPWTWILIGKICEEVVRTVMLANEVSETITIFVFDPMPLFFYFVISSILMFVVNSRVGENGVNLASGFLGTSELSASIRDSGILNLWSIGLWLPMVTIIFMAQFDGFTDFSLVSLLAIIAALHVFSHLAGFRIGGAIGILLVLTFATVIIQWNHGLENPLMILVCLTIALILYFESDSLFGVGIGLMSFPMLVYISGREPHQTLESTDWASDFIQWLNISSTLNTEVTAIVCTSILLAVYLPRAERMEDILKPATSTLVLLVITNSITFVYGQIIHQIISGSIFVGASIWLISRGEIRTELRSVAIRDSLVSLAGSSESISYDGNLSSYRPRLAEMAELRKKKREKAESKDPAELLISNLTHTPVVGLTVLFIVITVTILFSAISPQPYALFASGAFCSIIVLLIRNRTKGLELELPHILGIEMPIATVILGMCLAFVTGHVIPAGSSPYELLDLAVVSVLSLVLCSISLLHHSNILDRIDIAIDWFVFPLLISRSVGAVILGSLPFPLMVNPLDGSTLNWVGPWMLVESLLVLCVVLGFWVEQKREQLGRKGSSGLFLGSRTISIVLMSFGPAGLLAAITSSYSSVRLGQSPGLGLAILGMVMSFISIAEWSSVVNQSLDILVMTIGVVLIICCALTVPLELERWTMTFAVDGHILVAFGAFLIGQNNSLWFPIMLILMSTTLWVVGILQLRRGLRIWGLADLIAALLFAIVFASTQIDQQEVLLGMAILALELGIVAWLAIANQEELSRD